MITGALAVYVWTLGGTQPSVTLVLLAVVLISLDFYDKTCYSSYPVGQHISEVPSYIWKRDGIKLAPISQSTLTKHGSSLPGLPNLVMSHCWTHSVVRVRDSGS